MRLPRIATASAMASILLIAGTAGCSADDEPESVTTIVIGADLTNSSAVDTAYARALQLRIEQVNASGQLGKNTRLLLRTQDNRADPTASLRNISAFADDPNVAAVVTGSCDACVVDAAKTISDKRIPTIALAAADEVTIPIDKRRYVFKLGPNSADSAAALVAELARVGTSNVAVLSSDDLYGRGSETALRAELRKAGITVQAARTIKPAGDVGETVGELVADRPAALVVLTAPEPAGQAATSAKAAGYRGRVFFDAGAASDMFIPTAAAAATNNATMVFTQILAIDDVIATTPAKASRKQWFRDYTSRYGSYSGVASFAGDATDLIADAVARVGADRGRIRDIIETSQIDGLSGPIRLTPDNHSGLMPQALTLLVARSGRWRLAS